MMILTRQSEAKPAGPQLDLAEGQTSGFNSPADELTQSATIAVQGHEDRRRWIQ